METILIALVLVAAPDSAEAREKALHAYAVHNGIDDSLERYQRVLLTGPQREHLGSAAVVAKVIVERRITFKWEF